MDIIGYPYHTYSFSVTTATEGICVISTPGGYAAETRILLRLGHSTGRATGPPAGWLRNWLNHGYMIIVKHGL